jgi:hypothetical protein
VTTVMQPVKCRACSWENADRKQWEWVIECENSDIQVNLPMTYHILGSCPMHTCGLNNDLTSHLGYGEAD